MSNSQTDLQITAYYATFLVNNRRKPSSEDEKRTCPNGQVLFIISESLITPRQLPGRRPTETDYQGVVSISGNIWETFRVYSARSASMSQYPQFY